MAASIGNNDCTCESSSFSQRPQNRYLAHMLEEFEKCTVQTSGVSILQKEHQIIKKEIQDARSDMKDIKLESQIHTDKINSLQQSQQQQKLLHVQLRDEIANEFRTLYRKVGTQDKDIELVKQQIKTNSKKMTLELETLHWDLSTKQRIQDAYNPTDFIADLGNGEPSTK